jgi:hypothetical protein
VQNNVETDNFDATTVDLLPDAELFQCPELRFATPSGAVVTVEFATDEVAFSPPSGVNCLAFGTTLVG